MGTPGIDPPADDQEAKDVLSIAYENQFGDINLFALGFAQAIGLKEGKYGKWGPGNKSNNWGAVTTSPKADGTCRAGSFAHKDSDEHGEYTTCFLQFDTALEGAENLLTELFENRPAVFQAAVNGTYPEAIRQMYASKYFLGTAPHEQKDANGEYTNVNRYIAFVQSGIDQISPLYTPEATPSSGFGTGAMVALGAAGVIGVIAIANR